MGVPAAAHDLFGTAAKVTWCQSSLAAAAAATR